MTNRATLPSGVTVHPPGPKRRHWSRVVASSVDLDRLLRLDTLAVDDDHMPSLVASACGELGVPVPLLRFHARRSPYTGACEHPRAYWVAVLGEDALVWRESNGWGPVPEQGAIRLGRTCTVMTLAHELGHHVVFHRDPPSTPAHGNRWVARFDDAARVLETHLLSPG